MAKKKEQLAFIAKQFLELSNKNISYRAALLILQKLDLEDRDSRNLLKKLALHSKNLWPNKPILFQEDIKKVIDMIMYSSPMDEKNNVLKSTNQLKTNNGKRLWSKNNQRTLVDFLRKEENLKKRKSHEEIFKTTDREETKFSDKNIEMLNAIKKSHIDLHKITSRKIQQVDNFKIVEKEMLRESDKVKVDIIKTITSLQAKESYEFFNKMFRYRFNKLKNILISKGLKNIINSSELKNIRHGEEHHLIVMVYEKRITKGGKGGLLIGEDEGGFVTIYVPLNGDLLQKFNRVLLDSVIGIRFRKMSGGMVLCEDIIFAGPSKARKRSIPNEQFKMVFVSDLHVGSKQFLKGYFKNFIKFVNGEIEKPWAKKLAREIKFIGIVGDLVDGVGVYPNQREELEVDVIYDQFDELYNYIKLINEEIEIIAIPGNHDPAGKFIPQPPIPNDFLGKLSDLPNFKMLGNPSLLSVEGVKVLLYHGQGLEDIASALSIGILEPTRMMVEEIRNLHLLPTWGYKSVIPSEYDPLLIEEIPDIYVSGHLHRIDARITTLGSSLLINSSTFQGITSWQIKMGIEPTPGIFPIVDLPSYDVYFIKCDDVTCELLNRYKQ